MARMTEALIVGGVLGVLSSGVAMAVREWLDRRWVERQLREAWKP